MLNWHNQHFFSEYYWISFSCREHELVSFIDNQRILLQGSSCLIIKRILREFRMVLSRWSLRFLFQSVKDRSKSSNVTPLSCLLIGIVPYGLITEFLHVVSNRFLQIDPSGISKEKIIQQRSSGISMEPKIKNGSYIICLNTVGHLRNAFQNKTTESVVPTGFC